MNTNMRRTRTELIGHGTVRIKFLFNNKVIVEATCSTEQAGQLVSLCLQYTHEGLGIDDVERVLKHVLTSTN